MYMDYRNVSCMGEAWKQNYVSSSRPYLTWAPTQSIILHTPRNVETQRDVRYLKGAKKLACACKSGREGIEPSPFALRPKPPNPDPPLQFRLPPSKTPARTAIEPRDRSGPPRHTRRTPSTSTEPAESQPCLRNPANAKHKHSCDKRPQIAKGR